MRSAAEQRQELHERIANNFAAHPPKDQATKELLDRVAEAFEDVGHLIIDACPPGRELSLALTNLEAAKRDAVAAIACHQDEL